MRLHSRSLARSLSTTNDYWRWSRVIFDDGPQRWPAHKKMSMITQNTQLKSRETISDDPYD